MAAPLNPGTELLLIFVAGLLAGAGITLLVATTPDVPKTLRRIWALWRRRGRLRDPLR